MTSNGKSITSPDDSVRPHQEKSAFLLALPQFLAVMVKNVLLVTYGNSIGYTTILIPGLSGNDPKERFHLNQDQISWIGSLTTMLIPLGCFFSGVVTQPIGRRRAMQLINIPSIICWIIFRYATEVWHIYFALGLSGFVGGLFEAPILTYVSEITQPHLRGLLSATAGFSIMVGVLMQFLLGTFLDWRTLALVSAVLPIISFILLCFIPESPHWLIMNDKFEEARKSLAWLRGWVTIEEIEPEFKELMILYNLKEDNQREKFNLCHSLKSKFMGIKDFGKKNFLWPLALVSFIYFLVNFSGSTTLQTYAIKLFATLKVPIDEYHATVLLGVAEFVGCILSILLVHYLGKRKMAFFSILGNGISAMFIATFAYLTNVQHFVITSPANFSIANNVTTAVVFSEPSEYLSYRWVLLVSVIVMAFAAHCGIRALPWILLGEVYPKETRSTGCGVSGAIAYVFAFSANKTFLQLVSYISLPGVYWFQGSLSFLGTIILYFTLPETEGKTLQEITDHFSGISKLDNKIKKKNNHPQSGVINLAYDEKAIESDNIKMESKM